MFLIDNLPIDITTHHNVLREWHETSYYWHSHNHELPIPSCI